MKHAPVALALASGGLLCLVPLMPAQAQAAAPPRITRFSPTLGPQGTLVQISGSHFSGATLVAFHHVPARFTVNSDRLITALVPPDAATGMIQVLAPGGQTFSATPFTLGDRPVALTLLTPNHGPTGTLVQISGAYLLGATQVKFHGVPAHFTVTSDSRITAIVPADATTGPISVVTPSGAATSKPFVVR